MAANNAQNELDALKKLITLSNFALIRSVRLEEIQRQLSNANAMVPLRSGSAADDRFRAHDAALRKFLDRAGTREAVTDEVTKTQKFLELLGP